MVVRNSSNQGRAQFFNNLEQLAGESSSGSSAARNRAEMSSIRPPPSNDERPPNISRSNSVFGDEVQRLVQQITDLYLNDELSDVTLIVESSRFPAHKVILAARSIYFKAMFFGGLKESKENTVELLETPVQAFKVLLEYIYTGKMVFKEMKTDLVFDILGLVHKYGFTELEHNVSEYLKEICKPENVCSIFSHSQLFSMRSLAAHCLDFMDFHAEEVLAHPTFRNLSPGSLEQIISRDSFCAPEISIFKAVKEWMDASPEESHYFMDMMKNVRLSLIKLDDLLNIIRPSGLIPPDVLLDAINDQTRCKTSDLGNRGFKFSNVNVATPEFGVKIFAGENSSKHIFLESVPSESERNAIKHPIKDKDPGIVVELSRHHIINHIRFQLPEREQRSFSYFIEVSVDKSDWVRVIDHKKYLCRNKQNLFFNQRIIKFIRICGTFTTSSTYTFQIHNLEIMFSTENVDVDTSTTLTIPKHNVATIQNNANVIEGVSRSRNALLNGDTRNYDWDNGYTCHQLQSGSIIVQLAQPYMIDSIGLLLWDCDDRQYSYYIEVSTDQTNWTRVVEENEVSSWRRLTFELQPVTFIKVVGTHNSANEVFHLVHLEAPAAEDYPTGSNAASNTRQFAGIGEGLPQMINNLEQGIERIAAIEQPD
jgi:BTB/POZ domain-containing protein 9